MNDRVKKYEKRVERLNRCNMYGLAAAIAAAGATLTEHPQVSGFVPLGGWLLQYLFKDADPSRDLVAERWIG